MAVYREKGYISHASPTPIARNITNDHTAYLIRCAVVCPPSPANAIDTSNAKITIAGKWLRCNRLGCTG